MYIYICLLVICNYESFPKESGQLWKKGVNPSIAEPGLEPTLEAAHSAPDAVEDQAAARVYVRFFLSVGDNCMIEKLLLLCDARGARLWT